MNNLLLCFVFNEHYKDHMFRVCAVEFIGTPLSSAQNIFTFMEEKYLKNSPYHPSTYKTLSGQNSNQDNVQVIVLPIKNFSSPEKMERTINHWVSYVQQKFPEVSIKEKLDISESLSTMSHNLFETYRKLDEVRMVKSSIHDALHYADKPSFSTRKI